MGTSNYSDEFKRDAVHQISVQGYAVREVSGSLGVNTHSLYKCIKHKGLDRTQNHPCDLDAHNCLTFNINRSLDTWPFDGTQRQEEARLDRSVKGNMRLDNGETVRRLCLASLGIARLSEIHVGPDIRSGRLVPLLEDYNPGDTEPVNALYVDHAHLSARIRVFIDYLAASTKARPEPLPV